MTIATAMADSFKVELLQGAHCFNAPVTCTGTVSGSGVTTFTAISNGMTGIAVGMSVTSTTAGLQTSTCIASILSTSSFTIAPAATAAMTTQTLTITGDVFKMALMKAPTTNAYTNSNSTNYSVMSPSDEVVAGAGYTTGGNAMINVTAILAGGAGGQAIVTFSQNPSWVTATFSTIGCMIYNSTDRYMGVTGRCCGVFDFGGTQTVSNGTFTVVMPNASSASAILRVA